MAERPDDLAQLEQRVATLEMLVRRLLASGAPIRETPISTPVRPAAVPVPPLSSVPPLRKPPLAPTPAVDWEQWFGSRGLLLVGVVALLVSGGFFLKYAFDHGWIAPWLRVLGGLVAGIALALVGERQVTRGLRRFGLAMIGAGGGLVYLAVWAAAGPYQMIGRLAGILLIAAATAVVTSRAAHHEAEPLALWALLGAFAAPLLLPAPDARPEALLAYLALVSYAGGALAHYAQWRLAFGVTLVGYFVLTPLVVPDVMITVPGFAYAALGGMMALRGVRDRPWPEARFGGQALAWVLLIVYTSQTEGAARWAATLFGAALLLTTWWDSRRDARFQDVDFREIDAHGLVFLIAPAAFCAVASIAKAGPLAQAPELAATAVAALYLLTGWRGRWAMFVALGLAAVALAVAQQWTDAMLVAEWSALIVLAVLIEARLDQRGGPVVALLLTPVAFVRLLAGLMGAPEAAAAFGPWSLALYANVAALMISAMQWRRREGAPEWHGMAPPILWTFAGVTLFAGISILIQHFFAALAGEFAGARIAGDLAISLYWLLYAAGLVSIGFKLDRGVVRSAGLAVAGLAALKVALFDLSRLEALYRVASFFGLSLIALAVAYAYNRRRQRIAEPAP